MGRYKEKGLDTAQSKEIFKSLTAAIVSLHDKGEMHIAIKMLSEVLLGTADIVSHNGLVHKVSLEIIDAVRQSASVRHSLRSAKRN